MEEMHKTPSESPKHGAHIEDTHPSDELAEIDRPPNGVIGLAVFGTLVVLGIIVVGVNQLFGEVLSAEISDKVLSRTNSELRELRADEDAKLGRYQWVSEKDKVVRIPLDRAIDLTLADYRNPKAQREAEEARRRAQQKAAQDAEPRRTAEAGDAGTQVPDAGTQATDAGSQAATPTAQAVDGGAQAVDASTQAAGPRPQGDPHPR